MSTRIITLALLVVGLAITPAFAAKGEKGDKEGRGKRMQAMLEEFDADGDGKLSKEERQAARAARGEKGNGKGKGKGGMQEMKEKFDTDGDGKLNEAERTAARESVMGRRGAAMGPMGVLLNDPDQAFKNLDKDGDGVLNRSEFQALVERAQSMRDAVSKRRGARGSAGRPKPGAAE